jgi:CBS-domain-containing membrane protein
MRTARDIMSTAVLTVRTDTSIDELARKFAEARVSGFPVLNAAGSLVGVVTEGDLIHQNQRLHIPTAVAIFDAVIYLGSSKRLEEEVKRVAATRVDEIMTPDPVTVHLDTPVEEVASLMADQEVHTIPVLDNVGSLVGVIGKLDVIRSMASP